MNDGVVNPYASPSAVKENRSELYFDATIEERDYVSLLSVRDFEWLLYLILTWLLVITTLMIAIGMTIALVAKGWNTVLIPVLGLGLATGAGLVFVTRYRRPTRRAKRNLKRLPDLLGAAHGKATETGLVFDDGNSTHWFAPQLLVASTANRHGLRVRFDKDPRCFWALTSRMFDHYSHEVAERLVDAWRLTVAESDESERAREGGAWRELAVAPEHAVEFTGTFEMEQAFRTPAYFRKTALELLSAVCVIVVAAVCSWILGRTPYVLSGLGLFYLVSNARNWWRYFRGSKTKSWNQEGWMSASHLAMLRDHYGARIPAESLCQVGDNGSVISLQSDAGSVFYLARDHVKDEKQWEQMRAWCQAWQKETAVPEHA